MDPQDGISPCARRRSIMVRMEVHQSVGSQYFHIQINSGDPHFVRLYGVLAMLPFYGLTELERFGDINNPSPLPIVAMTGEEGEGDRGTDEPLSTDEEDGGEDDS